MVQICMICISSIESDVYNKKKIQMFGVNMTFISSNEVKNVYFMSAFGTHEIYIFSLQSIGTHEIYIFSLHSK